MASDDPSMPPPPHRVALVTGGAGGGIGSGISRALLTAGWHVLVVDSDAAAIAELERRLAPPEGTFAALALDITDEEAPERAVMAAIATFGRLDGLVNSAGIGLVRPLGDIDDGAFDRLFNVDFRAAFRFCRAALPHLIKTRGAIVNLGSVQAVQAMAGYGLYGSFKAAIEALTRGLAVDYGPAGVRANCIHPGFVPSPQGDALIAAFAPDVDAWVARYAATKQALPVIVGADQVGRLVAFLLAPENAAITGQAIVIDGGTTTLLYDREPDA